MPHRRVRLLNAIARMLDAVEEVMEAALDLEIDDPPPTPSNVHREPEKTGPRLPFKSTPAPPSRKSPGQYTFSALSSERMLAFVVDVWKGDPSSKGRARTLAIMTRLVDLGLVSAADLAAYLKEPKR